MPYQASRVDLFSYGRSWPESRELPPSDLRYLTERTRLSIQKLVVMVAESDLG